MAKKPAKAAPKKAGKKAGKRGRRIVVDTIRVISALAKAERADSGFLHAAMDKMAVQVLTGPLTLKQARAIFKDMGRTDFELLLETMDHAHVEKLLKNVDPYSPFLANWKDAKRLSGEASYAPQTKAHVDAMNHIIRLLASKVMKPEPKPAGRQPTKKVPKSAQEGDKLPEGLPYGIAAKPGAKWSKSMSARPDAEKAEWPSAMTAKPSRQPSDEIPFPGQQPHPITTKPPHAATDFHIGTLRSAGTDEAEFVKALTALRDDKGISNETLYSIAHQYIGGRTKWPTRKAAIEAIKTRFIERNWQASKMELIQLKNFTPW